MATKSTCESLRKAKPDEPIFVLRAQDMLAPALVRKWAQQAQKKGCPAEKVREAQQCAEEMERWAHRKWPD